MAQSSNDPANVQFYPNRPGTFKQIIDTAANDADKVITVTADKVWQVLHVFMSYAADANAANRTVTMNVGDGTNTIGLSQASAVQTANTTEYYHWIPGATVPVETIATHHYLPYPGPVMLPAGYTLTFDAANDQVGDDTIIRIEVIEFEA